MTDSKAIEIEKRERALANARGTVAGSGIRGRSGSMPQMVSVRLDGDLVAELRHVANVEGSTMSDLLREAAELVVEGKRAERRSSMSVVTSRGFNVLTQMTVGAPA